MTLRRDPSKALQVGFLALLVVSIATVGWWMTDAVLTTRAFERRVEALYAADAQAVAAAYAGAPATELARLLPHLAIEGRSATVRPAALAELAQQGAEPREPGTVGRRILSRGALGRHGRADADDQA